MENLSSYNESKFMKTLEDIREKYKGQIPVPIVSIATDCDIQVYGTDDFKDSESGSITKEDGKFVIYVNTKHPETRQRFTIAHELAHYLQHRSILDLNNELVSQVKQPILNRNEQANLTPDEQAREGEANQMAADILMPEEEFRVEWEKTNNIEEIAKKFNVSVSAATIRAQKLFKSFIA